MANERLRVALLENGSSLKDIATTIGVDPKTIEKWIAGRIPHRRTQYALAAYLKRDVAYLWAADHQAGTAAAAGQAELVALYPHRASVPHALWTDIYRRAEGRLDLLAYGGFWLSEDLTFVNLIREKAEVGAEVRILLGDPASEIVRQRGEDEGVGSAMAAKIHNALLNYRHLFGLPGIEFRLHRTILYNSIYRAGEEMLVNTHVHGVIAYRAPVMHLRHLPEGTMFATYVDSFERIWADARTIAGPVDAGLV